MYLGDPLGGQLGPQNRTEVVILKDEEDGESLGYSSLSIVYVCVCMCVCVSVVSRVGDMGEEEQPPLPYNYITNRI